MGATYTRQSSSSIADGSVIEASHFNNEFDQLLAAFASSTGHTHDGTDAEGGPITKLLGTSITIGDATAGTDITVTFDGETSDGVLKWMEDEDYFEFSDDILVASTEKLQFRDTAIYINSSTDGQLDLVADTEIQIAATTVDINGNVDVSGTLTVAGAVDFGDAALSNVGAVQLDSIAGDGDTNTSITFSGSDVITIATGGENQVTFTNGAIVPSTDNDLDLGTSSVEFKDAFFDGTVTTDAIVVAGTIGHDDDTDLLTLANGILTVAGEVSMTTLDIGGTNVTSTAAELNILDGVTATASELNILDGVTATTSELNILDGVTSTASELNLVDGITAGTVSASKAVIVDSNKDLTGLRNLTISGDLTVSGDDITMGTNTAGNLLIADGTNFNSVAVGSLSEISSVANDDVLLAVDTSGGGLKKIARSTLVSGLATSGAISNVAEDSTPQLGGDLDVNGNDIVSVSNGNINLLPNGSGKVIMDGNGSSGGVSITDGNIDIRTGTGSVAKVLFYCESSNAHAQTLQAAPHSAGSSAVLVLPTASGDLVGTGDSGTVTNGMLAGSIADSKLNTITTADKVSGAAVQIDGATDGTSITIADSDKLLVDDGGTTKYVNASQLNSYISAEATAIAADNITAGDAAINFTTTAGNITIDAQGNDTDIILKGTDGSSDTTFLTIDGSAAGAATFNSDVTVGALLKMPDVTSGKILVGDGTSYEEVAVSGDVTIASSGAVTIAASAVENSMLAGSIADSKLNTISTAGKVALTALEIDGGTDINADLTDSDLIIVDDGAGGTNRKAALSRLTTFMTGQGFSTEDPTALAIALG